MKTKQIHLTLGLLTCLALRAAASSTQAQTPFSRITDSPVATNLSSPLTGSWGDYDNDGFVDLFVGGGFGQKDFLYRNRGDGSFAQVTTGEIVTAPSDTTSAVWGDYDNDGDLDLFISNYANPPQDRLFQNNGDGTFARLKTGAIVNDGASGLASAWADFDNDGWLDLIVANSFSTTVYVYRGLGNGSFRHISAGPLVTDGGNAQSVAWGDFDNDGDLDIAVGNYAFAGNKLVYRNAGGGRFVRLADGAPMETGSAAEGVAWADFDNDGDLDLMVARAEKSNDWLYENRGDGTFRWAEESVVSQDGVDSSSPSFGDYDNDGWLDLLVTAYGGASNRLYHNNGDGTFSLVTTGPVAEDGGGDTGTYGGAWADFDNDGDLDLFVAASGPDPNTMANRASFLYRNNGNQNGWVMFRLVGAVSNRSAIGAKVRLKATIGGKTFWQLREISAGSGWTSQHDLRAHFGLGNASKIEAVRIEWPSGIVEEVTDAAINKIHTRVEPHKLKAIAPGRIQIVGLRDFQYLIEGSEDLRNWVRIGTAAGGLEVIDAAAAGLPSRRFYRASVLPR